MIRSEAGTRAGAACASARSIARLREGQGVIAANPGPWRASADSAGLTLGTKQNRGALERPVPYGAPLVQGARVRPSWGATRSPARVSATERGQVRTRPAPARRPARSRRPRWAPVASRTAGSAISSTGARLRNRRACGQFAWSEPEELVGTRIRRAVGYSGDLAAANVGLSSSANDR